jgi:hypothetical protein
MGALRRCRLQRQVPDPDPPAKAAQRQAKLEAAKPIVVATTPDWAAARWSVPASGAENTVVGAGAGSRDLRAKVVAVANPACVIRLL